MAINNWSIDERPRERLLKNGAIHLSDAELLAILLRVGRRGKTAVDLARDLINHFGGLRLLLEAPYEEVAKCSGIGIAKYVQMQAALELAKRHLAQYIQKKDILNNVDLTKKYLASQLRHRQQEVFACLFLNSRNFILSYEELFYGTVNSSTVHPREIVKRALTHNAAGIILAHNHPSGLAEPSLADKQITHHLLKALALVDVNLLDHIIIGDEKIMSFVEEGLL